MQTIKTPVHVQYARHYHACEGQSLHGLTLHPLYTALSPLQRLCLDIERDPHNVGRGLAFLLIERIEDYVVVSIDVESPMGYAMLGGIEVTLREGAETMVGMKVPPLDTEEACAPTLHTTCDRLLALAHQVPVDRAFPIPHLHAERYHPAWPTREALRAVLAMARTEGSLHPLGKARLRSVRRGRQAAISARMRDVRPAATMSLFA